MKMRRIIATAPNPNATGNNDSIVYVKHDDLEERYVQHEGLRQARKDMMSMEMKSLGVESIDIKWDEATFDGPAD